MSESQGKTDRQEGPSADVRPAKQTPEIGLSSDVASGKRDSCSSDSGDVRSAKAQGSNSSWELNLMLLLSLQLSLPPNPHRVGRGSRVRTLIPKKPLRLGALWATVLGIRIPRLRVVWGLLRRRQKLFRCQNFSRILTPMVLSRAPRPRGSRRP